MIFRMTIFVLIISIAAACSRISPQSPSTSTGRHPANTSQSPVMIKATPASTASDDIRSKDFNNIAYPNLPDYSDDRVKRRKNLKPGEGKPNVIFGDVTGDGKEDAIAVFGISNKGSAVPHYIYVFTLEKGILKLIWDFETGDRADGGLKKIYPQDGNLTIELYGKDRYIGGKLYRGDEALCCPEWFTRSAYRWTGRQFEIIGKETMPLKQS